MEQIGFSLVDAGGQEVEALGAPAVDGNDHLICSFRIPDTNDVVHSPKVGANYGAFKLVKKFLNDDPPVGSFKKKDETTAFNGTVLITTINYEEFVVPPVLPGPPIDPKFDILGRLDKLEAKVGI